MPEVLEKEKTEKQAIDSKAKKIAVFSLTVVFIMLLFVFIMLILSGDVSTDNIVAPTGPGGYVDNEEIERFS